VTSHVISDIDVDINYLSYVNRVFHKSMERLYLFFLLYRMAQK